MTTDRLLLWLVRANASVILLAMPCALLPFTWMEAMHSDVLGLGPLPDLPITKYMARSLSLVYAMHGLVMLSVSLNWPRHRPLVPIFAGLHIAFGGAMAVVDLSSGMPVWWTLCEGPAIIGVGVVILAVYRQASPPLPS